MANEIIRYAKGGPKPPGLDRQAATDAKQVFNEVRLAVVEVDGSMLLAAHIMERALDLNGQRVELAGDDVGINMMLADIQATAMRQVKSIQNQLYTGW